MDCEVDDEFQVPATLTLNKDVISIANLTDMTSLASKKMYSDVINGMATKCLIKCLVGVDGAPMSARMSNLVPMSPWVSPLLVNITYSATAMCLASLS